MCVGVVKRLNSMFKKIVLRLEAGGIFSGKS